MWWLEEHKLTDEELLEILGFQSYESYEGTASIIRSTLIVLRESIIRKGTLSDHSLFPLLFMVSKGLISRTHSGYLWELRFVDNFWNRL